MRMFGFLFATLFFACLNPAYVYAQDSEEQIEPYRKHRDTRHGHDHVYPDRGAIFRNLPRGAFVVNYAGLSYRFYDGIWFEPRGPAFMVVEPPIGVMVPTLPPFATWVAHGKGAYLYVNGVFYEARPELGGYEVVNDPGEAVPFDRTGATVGATPSTSPSPAQPASAATAPQTSAALLAAPAVVVGPPAPTSTSAAGLAGSPPPGAFAAQATRAVVPTSAMAGTSAALPPASSLAGSTAAVPVPTPPASSGSASYSLGASGSGVIPASASATTLSASAPGAPVPVPTPTSLAASGSGTSPTSAPAATLPASAAAGPTAAPPVQSASLTTMPGAGTSPAAPTTLPAGPLPSAGPPPPAPQLAAPTPQMGSKVFVYPRNGQTADQQARDRYECYRFAVAQSGFDPMHASGASQAARAEPQSDYDRAQAACLEGHGYTVR